MPSTSYNFNQTQLQIVTTALQLLNVYGVDETIPAADYNFCSNILNMLIKYWNTQDLHLFEKKEGYLFTQSGQNTYTLDSSVGDNITNSYVQTSTTLAYAAAVTVIVVASATGITNGDNIGIQQTDGSTFWTTVSTHSGTSITLSAGLSIGCAASAIVYDYTAKIDKPLRIHHAQRRDASAALDIPMLENSNRDYWDLPNKSSLGVPLQWYYLPGASTGIIYLWQTPNDARYIVCFSYDKIISDLDNSTDTTDFPSEWLLPLSYSLAVAVGPAYGKYQEIGMLKPAADELVATAKSFDQETASIRFQPNYQGRRR